MLYLYNLLAYLVGLRVRIPDLEHHGPIYNLLNVTPNNPLNVSK